MDVQVHVRRTAGTDVSLFGSVFSDQISSLLRRFGDFTFRSLVETSAVSITATDEQENIVGFGSFSDYASLRTALVPAKEWEKWMASNYQLEGAPFTAVNTLWLNLFASEALYESSASLSILESVFTTLPDVHTLLIALPVDASLSASLSTYFSEITPKSADSLTTRVYLCRRELFFPEIVVRRGRVEDYDDLQPLVEREGDSLSTVFGDYFLAQLLEKQDEFNRVLVAQFEDKIVGVMCVSANDPELASLGITHQLEDLDGLCKLNSPPKSAEAALEFSEPESVEQQMDRMSMAVGGPETNAFRIRLFSLKQEFNCHAEELLQSAFGLFPDREYALLTLPFALPEIDLAAKFTPVRSRMGTSGSHGLFVVCRYSLRPDYTVQRVTADDLSSLSSLIEGQEDAGSVPGAIASKDNKNIGFSLNVGGQPVALAIVQHLSADETSSLRTQFEIDSVIDFGVSQPDSNKHLSLSFFSVNPVFANHTRFFWRDILRQTECNTLFYNPPSNRTPSESCTREMLTVRPRSLSDTLHGAQLASTAEHPSFLTSRRFLSEPKQRVNARIVVVGGSSTGLSFLYNLLAVPYLTFTNLVLLSPNGIPQYPTKASHIFSPDRCALSKAEYALMEAKGRVSIVFGRLEQLDRASKTIVTSEGETLNYDYLMFATGKPFKHTLDMAQYPAGYVSHSNDFSFLSAVEDFVIRQEQRGQTEASVVVYGKSIEAFLSVQALLDLGLEPHRIHLVLPLADSSSSPFVGDVKIFDQVMKAVAVSGVNIVHNAALTRVDVAADEYVIYSAFFEIHEADGDIKNRAIDCPLLIDCAKRSFDVRLLRPLHSQSLVVDGGIIVDSQFQTNDASIFACGPGTRLSGRLRPAIGSNSLELDSYSSRESGDKLAESFLNFLEGMASSPESTAQALSFRTPVAWSTPVPGGFYFAAHTPAWRAAECRELCTESDQGRYCRVSLTPGGRIAAIVYFGRSQIDTDYILSLIGKSADLLGGLPSQYSQGSISDLMEFLSSGATRAASHDRLGKHFESVSASIRGLPDSRALLSLLKGKSPEDLSQLNVQSLLANVDDSTKEFIKAKLVSFLQDNKDLYTFLGGKA